jgi:hypothetical protein
MWTVAKATVLGFGLLTGAVVTADAQYYYNPFPTYSYPWYYSNPNYYYSGYPYYYPGYSYYNYPSYDTYLGTPYPGPRSYWDPYVGWRPYSDNAGPKASGHGSP